MYNEENETFSFGSANNDINTESNFDMNSINGLDENDYENENLFSQNEIEDIMNNAYADNNSVVDFNNSDGQFETEFPFSDNLNSNVEAKESNETQDVKQSDLSIFNIPGIEEKSNEDSDDVIEVYPFQVNSGFVNKPADNNFETNANEKNLDNYSNEKIEEDDDYFPFKYETNPNLDETENNKLDNSDLSNNFEDNNNDSELNFIPFGFNEDINNSLTSSESQFGEVTTEKQDNNIEDMKNEVEEESYSEINDNTVKEDEENKSDEGINFFKDEQTSEESFGVNNELENNDFQNYVTPFYDSISSDSSINVESENSEENETNDNLID